MNIDPNGLLSFCAIGFGTLLAAFSVLMHTRMAKTKETPHYFQAAFYNSIRFSQLTSVILIICCCLILIGHHCRDGTRCFSASAWMACIGTCWVAVSFFFYFFEAMRRILKDITGAISEVKKYKRLNSPPES